MGLRQMESAFSDRARVTAEGGHVPVLAGPVLEFLQVQERGTYVDCTVGAGGHAALIAGGINGGRLLCLDRDPQSIAVARRRLSQFNCVTVLHRNYGELSKVLQDLGLEAVDGILLDVGFSSLQLDDAKRGFSFQEEGPLDMRMDTTQGMTAREFLASIHEGELVRVLKTYGDVGPARRIAKAIVRRRQTGSLRTTRDLAQAVAGALDFVGGVPEETRTVFQAIRIAVNDELTWLEAGVRQAIDALAVGGRLVAISFHSGEDRVVKNVFREAARVQRVLHPDGRVRAKLPARVKMLTSKPVQPSEDEIRRNPRSRSAKLRAVERLTRKEKAG